MAMSRLGSNITIPESHYPRHLTENQFDIAFAFVEEDKNEARKIIEILQKFGHLGNSQTLPAAKICIVYQHEGFVWIQNQIKTVAEALKRSTLVFMLLTENYVKDGFADTFINEAVMRATSTESLKYTNIPVYIDESQFQQDHRDGVYGMRSQRGWEVSKMFESGFWHQVNEQLDNVEVEALQKENLCSRFLGHMSELLHCYAHLREKREKDQERALQKWIMEETARRLKEEAEQRQEDEAFQEDLSHSYQVS